MKSIPKNNEWREAVGDDNILLENNVVFLLDEAFENLGTSLYYDRFLAQVLAIVYVYGCEEITLNKNIQNIMGIAMKRFNIYGGLRPTRRGVRLIKTAIKSLQKRGLTDPFWKPIAERLGLSRNLEMMKIMAK